MQSENKFKKDENVSILAGRSVTRDDVQENLAPRVFNKLEDTPDDREGDNKIVDGHQGLGSDGGHPPKLGWFSRGLQRFLPNGGAISETVHGCDKNQTEDNYCMLRRKEDINAQQKLDSEGGPPKASFLDAFFNFSSYVNQFTAEQAQAASNASTTDTDSKCVQQQNKPLKRF